MTTKLEYTGGTFYYDQKRRISYRSPGIYDVPDDAVDEYLTSPDWSDVDGGGSTGPATGTGTIVDRERTDGLVATSVQVAADGDITVLKLPHSLGRIPTVVNVNATSRAGSVDHWERLATDQYVEVEFSTALPDTGGEETMRFNVIAL